MLVPAMRGSSTVIPGWSERTRPQMCNCTSGNLETPGSLVSLAPRNDIFQPFLRVLRLHPPKFRELVPEPGELPLGILAGICAAAFRPLPPRGFAPPSPDQRPPPHPLP